jgi:hypothetical protein
VDLWASKSTADAVGKVIKEEVSVNQTPTTTESDSKEKIVVQSKSSENQPGKSAPPGQPPNESFSVHIPFMLTLCVLILFVTLSRQTCTKNE